jgi:hypothetical protein
MSRLVVSRILIACILSLTLGATGTFAAVRYTEAQYQKVMALALSNFWGNAKLSNGSPVRPVSQQERVMLPIPYQHAKRVIDYSIPAGLAVWCGIDYVPYYNLYMKTERQKRVWTDKQIAFIGFLFGVSQGVAEVAYRSQACDEPKRSQVAATLRTHTHLLQRSLR